MKTLCLILILLNLNIAASAQETRIKEMVDSLKYSDTSFQECNSLYWRIVKCGLEVVPFLIEMISDTTTTQVNGICLGKYLNTGEVSYNALNEIIQIPIANVTQIQFDVRENGCLVGFAEHFRSHQSETKTNIERWYKKNIRKLVWRKFHALNMTNCRRQNGIYGFYNTR